MDIYSISFFFNLDRNRYNNAQPAHAQSVRVGHTGAVTGLDIPQERQGKVSAKIQQLLNTLKVRTKLRISLVIENIQLGHYSRYWLIRRKIREDFPSN